MMSEEKNDIRNRDFFRSIQRIGTWLSWITYPEVGWSNEISDLYNNLKINQLDGVYHLWKTIVRIPQSRQWLKVST